MRVSEEGLELIKRFEGLELEAYQDVVGVWTIGYGHTSMAGPPDVTPGMEISRDEAERILRRDLTQYEDAVEKAVKAPITQNMFDALVSITYNIGIGAMRKSTFIKRLNNKAYEAAAEAMHWWNKAGGRVVQGLKNRREAEAALFLQGYVNESDDAGNDPRGMTVEENTPRRSNLGQSRTMQGAGVAGAAGTGSILLSGGDDAEETESEETDTTNNDASEAEHPATGEEIPSVPVDLDEITDGSFLKNLEPAVVQARAEELWSAMQEPEGREALIVATSTLAVLAALYVAMARVDDWRQHKR